MAAQTLIRLKCHQAAQPYQRTIVVSPMRRFMIGDCKVVVLLKAKKVFRGGTGSIDSARIGLVHRNVTSFRHNSRARARSNNKGGHVITSRCLHTKARQLDFAYHAVVRIHGSHSEIQIMLREHGQHSGRARPRSSANHPPKTSDVNWMQHTRTTSAQLGVRKTDGEVCSNPKK